MKGVYKIRFKFVCKPKRECEQQDMFVLGRNLQHAIDRLSAWSKGRHFPKTDTIGNEIGTENYIIGVDVFSIENVCVVEL